MAMEGVPGFSFGHSDGRSCTRTAVRGRRGRRSPDGSWLVIPRHRRLDCQLLHVRRLNSSTEHRQRKRARTSATGGLDPPPDDKAPETQSPWLARPRPVRCTRRAGRGRAARGDGHSRSCIWLGSTRSPGMRSLGGPETRRRRSPDSALGVRPRESETLRGGSRRDAHGCPGVLGSDDPPWSSRPWSPARPGPGGPRRDARRSTGPRRSPWRSSLCSRPSAACLGRKWLRNARRHAAGDSGWPKKALERAPEGVTVTPGRCFG